MGNPVEVVEEDLALFVDKTTGRYIAVPMSELHAFINAGLEGGIVLGARVDRSKVKPVQEAIDKLRAKLNELDVR